MLAGDEQAGLVSSLLQSWRSGDLAARDRLFEIFYPDLRHAAAAMLRGEGSVSLSSGDLVHETVLKLVTLQRIEWQDRAHFKALASRMMRRALIDHARAKRRGKRAHHRVELHTGIPGEQHIDLDDLDFALERLAEIDPDRAEIVEMRYFGGMALGDIARVLALSESTVKRRWNAARIWLFQALAEETR